MSEVRSITVEIPTGDGPVRHVFVGRVAWCLMALIVAGAKGVTPIERPAPRWSAYVFSLRRAGIAIETIHEGHLGAFPGHHGRYVLRTPLRVIDPEQRTEKAA